MSLERAQPGQRVTVAASSQTAARAAADIADRGGNAVDAAIAATLTSLCVDVGLVAPAGSGFIHVWPRDGEPVLIDAYAEVPGRGLPPERREGRGESIYMEYGGGVTTLIGYGSVATPGAFLGLSQASERYGALPWKDVFGPVTSIVRDGFPLAPASQRYLHYSGEPIFGWHKDSRAALFHPDGRMLAGDERVQLPALVETLQRIAEEGAACLHGGPLGRQVADDVQRGGGALTQADLEEYEAIARDPVRVRAGEWDVAVNPAPAFGGVTLGAMLLLLDGFEAWDEASAQRMVDAQRAVLDYRGARLERGAEDSVHAAARELIDAARRGDLPAQGSSPSTIHTSAVDADGLACSITMSAGYGSGAIAEGTGLWLNNSLGEIELVGSGARALEPGTRLQSNMAPTIARRQDGSMLAIGSPGAGRIATAITQVLANFVHGGLPLWEAVTHPRLHVEHFGGRPTVAHEAGLPVAEPPGYVVRSFPGTDMYFGGIQAVLLDADGLAGAADPRRDGAVASGG